MKKITIFYTFWVVIACFNTISIKSASPVQNDIIYNQEIEKLSTQLENISFSPQEKKNLLIKLTNYFRNEDSPVFDNKKINVLYGSIILSYHNLLKLSKILAKEFQEQVIGKIWLHTNNFIKY